MWTLPIQRKEGPRKEIEYSADKYKKHGKMVTINNAATKVKEVEETRLCVRDEVTTILQGKEEEKSRKESRSNMTKWERNENEEMIKNKKYARSKDDDPKSLERPGQENDEDKVKKNEIEGWHNHKVQQRKQNMENEAEKIRKKKSKQTETEQCILGSDEDMNANGNKRAKTETGSNIKTNDRSQ